MLTIAVLITCHNRRVQTTACLDKLFSQSLEPESALSVYLVDDGCTDGTAEAVRGAFPLTTILQGDGTLFWCNGMRLAWQLASLGNPDHYLWLNDDTTLRPGAIDTLVRVASALDSPASIIVGTCCDPTSGLLTYGGTARSGRHPVRGSLVTPDPIAAKRCDIFNGNCVLVTRKAYHMLGNMSPFMHCSGDTDYGLRALRAGIPVLVAPGFLAECERNRIKGSWMDPNLNRMQRFKMFIGRKGLPPGDWWKLLWTHASYRAVLYWPIPYLRVLIGRRV